MAKKTLSIQRKILFYKLTVKRNEKNGARILNKGLKKFFEKSFEKHSPKKNIEGGYNIKTIKRELNSDKYTLDLIESETDYGFFRMGKSKDINSYIKRNFDDLKTDKIDLEDDQYIEAITFGMINYSTGILSIIYSKGAPGCQLLQSILIDTRLTEKSTGKSIDFSVDIAQVPNKNAIGLLRDMKFFSNMEFTLAIPSRELFDKVDDKPISNHLFEKMSQIDSKKVRIAIVGAEDSDDFDFSEVYDLAKEVYKLRSNTYKDSESREVPLVESCKVKGKFKDSEIMDVNIFDDKLTWQVSLTHEEGTTYIPLDNIKKSIVFAFEDKKQEILDAVATSDIPNK